MPEPMKGPDSKGLFRFWGTRGEAMMRGSGAVPKAASSEGTESENGPWGPFFVYGDGKNRPGDLFRRHGRRVRAGQDGRAPHS
jgi:hypothetical protein